MAMLSLFLFFVLFPQISTIYSRCQENPLCHLTNDSMGIICDTTFGNQNDSALFPVMSCFPPVKLYLFRNFQQIQPHAFQNITFPCHLVTIYSTLRSNSIASNCRTEFH